nr:ParB/RepB/Spo0J family partition protein [Myxococcus vastator]
MLSTARLSAKASATVEVATYRRRYSDLLNSTARERRLDDRSHWQTIRASTLEGVVEDAAARLEGFCGRRCRQHHQRYSEFRLLRQLVCLQLLRATPLTQAPAVTEAQRTAAIRLVNPSRISPPHEVRDTSKFERLVASMVAGGWQGRPLLVVPYRGRFRAITGSHRTAAARKAKVEVPCWVIPLCDALTLTHDFYDGTYRFKHDGGGIIDDVDWRTVLKELGHTEAADTMNAEIEANEAEVDSPVRQEARNV